MIGVDRRTGKPIGERDHIKQSIETILTTPQGTRPMKSELGFPALDKSTHAIRRDLSTMDVANMAMNALKSYEPRASFTRIDPETTDGTIIALLVHYSDSSGADDSVRVEMPRH